MNHYALYAIPAPHANAANRLFNVVYDDAGNNLSQPLSADGQEPATYYYGGKPVTAEEAAMLQGLSAALPTPAGGWPHGGVSAAEAQAAADNLEILVRSGPNSEELPEEARNALFADLGVQLVDQGS